MIVTIVLLLLAMTVHEVGLGDDTAKQEGRLTLNPLKHIDPFWTVLLPVMLYFATAGRFIFGMAKPVPVNFARLRHPRRDMVWVALAGPLTNLFFAVVLAFFFRISNNIYVLYGIYMNLGLALFNLIPIPPLDGSRIVAALLPVRWTIFYFQLERFGFILVLLLSATGALMRWVWSGMNLLCFWLGIPPVI